MNTTTIQKGSSRPAGGVRLCLALWLALGIGSATVANDARGGALLGRVLLNGQSTLHGWSCESLQAELNMPFVVDVEAAHTFFKLLMEEWPEEQGELLERLNGLYEEGVQFSVATPVASLVCGNRIMERDLSQAVRASQYPLVEVELGRVLDIAVRDNPGKDVLVLRTAGSITLGGQRRPVELEVFVELTEHDELRFRTGKDLLMTDFDVTPPTALMGLIRVDDRFRFDYELTLPVR